MSNSATLSLCFLVFVACTGCGAKSPLRFPPIDVVEQDLILPADGPELCGDGVDNNGNGRIDEGCPVCIRAQNSPWQIHNGRPLHCFGQTFIQHGDRDMYNFEAIPAVGDPGWSASAALEIDFMASSTLCGTECSCLNGGEFTFFQTQLIIPSGFAVNSFEVSMGSVDDGARVTVFNEVHPEGITDPAAYAFFPNGTTARLERYLVIGPNRIVITHVDDCCSSRALAGVRVVLNGGALEQCR